jgi:hypothetical protein
MRSRGRENVGRVEARPVESERVGVGARGVEPPRDRDTTTSVDTYARVARGASRGQEGARGPSALLGAANVFASAALRRPRRGAKLEGAAAAQPLRVTLAARADALDPVAALVQRGRGTLTPRALRAVERGLTELREGAPRLRARAQALRAVIDDALGDEGSVDAARARLGGVPGWASRVDGAIAELRGVLAALRASRQRALIRLGEVLVPERARALAPREAIAHVRVEVMPTAAARAPEEQLRAWVEEGLRLLGPRVAALEHVVLHGERPRACARLDGRIEVGARPSASVLFHELAHLLEACAPEVATLLGRWVDGRSALAHGGDVVVAPLASLPGHGAYGPHEHVKLDHFVTPYVGKLYPDGATEVLSVGFQHFVDARSMRDLLALDPEHFFLVLGALYA